MIRAGLMDEFIENVLGRLKDALAGFSDFLLVGELWLAVVALIAALVLVATFVPWQWLRGALGAVLVVAISLATGATLMWKRMRGETKPLRDHIKDLEAEKRKREGDIGRWF